MRTAAVGLASLTLFLGVLDRRAEANEAAAPLPGITVFNEGAWVPMIRHAVSVTGPGATPAGAATATLKSRLSGPKTYVVVEGAAAPMTLSAPRPRFRVFTDYAGAAHFQLAAFEVMDETRRSPIERGKSGTIFTRGIELEATKVGEGLWELRPKKSLQPGEYALATSEAEPVADFTVAGRGY